ncbi:hypothetical protein JCM3770_005312 [Rhodotorula araucariae]
MEQAQRRPPALRPPGLVPVLRTSSQPPAVGFEQLLIRSFAPHALTSPLERLGLELPGLADAWHAQQQRSALFGTNRSAGGERKGTQRGATLSRAKFDADVTAGIAKMARRQERGNDPTAAALAERAAIGPEARSERQKGAIQTHKARLTKGEVYDGAEAGLVELREGRRRESSPPCARFRQVTGKASRKIVLHTKHVDGKAQSAMVTSSDYRLFPDGVTDVLCHLEIHDPDDPTANYLFRVYGNKGTDAQNRAVRGDLFLTATPQGTQPALRPALSQIGIQRAAEWLGARAVRERDVSLEQDLRRLKRNGQRQRRTERKAAKAPATEGRDDGTDGSDGEPEVDNDEAEGGSEAIQVQHEQRRV